MKLRISRFSSAVGDSDELWRRTAILPGVVYQV
jgi:hypothetical protein